MLSFRLKPLDIEFMKRLHEKVNIIPLIAKADTLTPEECQQFKKQVSWKINITTWDNLVSWSLWKWWDLTSYMQSLNPEATTWDSKAK